MSSLKVYAWDGFRSEAAPRPNGSRQTRELLAAKSGAEAMRVAGFTRYFFNNMVTETGNDEEVALATSKPGRIFWTELDYGSGSHDWREVATAEL